MRGAESGHRRFCFRSGWSDPLAREKGKSSRGERQPLDCGAGVQFGASAVCLIAYQAVPSNLASLGKKASILSHPVRFLHLLSLLFWSSEQGMEHAYFSALNMNSTARGAQHGNQTPPTRSLGEFIWKARELDGNFQKVSSSPQSPWSCACVQTPPRRIGAQRLRHVREGSSWLTLTPIGLGELKVANYSDLSSHIDLIKIITGGGGLQHILQGSPGRGYKKISDPLKMRFLKEN